MSDQRDYARSTPSDVQREKPRKRAAEKAKVRVPFAENRQRAAADRCDPPGQSR